MKDFDEMKLARVIDACDGIDGRVKMQKIVYLLKAIGYDLPYDDFTIRQQGPFSRGVASDTDVLKWGGVIDEHGETLGENHGQPVRQYSYKVRGPIAPLIRSRFDIAAPPGKPGIAMLARRLRDCDRGVLEVAATKVYLRREGKLAGAELDAELQRLKGHLGDRFNEADALLAELELGPCASGGP
jgi:hypothetical protein